MIREIDNECNQFSQDEDEKNSEQIPHEMLSSISYNYIERTYEQTARERCSSNLVNNDRIDQQNKNEKNQINDYKCEIEPFESLQKCMDDDDSQNTPKNKRKLSVSTSNNQKNTAKKNLKMSIELSFKSIKDLKILQQIGKKNNRIVYTCKQRLNKQTYVLKEIPIIKDKKTEIINDLRILSKWGQGDCKENQHFVKFYDSWIEDDKLYILVEQCKYSLEKLMKERQSENTIRKLIIEISTGLNFLHQKKCFHLYIKPSNILLSQTNCFKISDFGISCLNNNYVLDYWTSDKRYVAPELNEINKGKQIDYNKCDIYSFGIILSQLIQGSKQKQMENHYSNKITNNYNYSSSLTYLIKRMTDQKPSNRPTAQEILDRCDIFTGLEEEGYLEIEAKYIKEENENLRKKIKETQQKLKKIGYQECIRRKKSCEV